MEFLELKGTVLEGIRIKQTVNCPSEYIEIHPNILFQILNRKEFSEIVIKKG